MTVRDVIWDTKKKKKVELIRNEIYVHNPELLWEAKNGKKKRKTNHIPDNCKHPY